MQGFISVRSIPTCVGKPRPLLHMIVARRVYPHVCGETKLLNPMDGQKEGLSPRVWGNPFRATALWRCHRSIPTCVGKPRPCPSGPTSNTVYPHVCGETIELFIVEHSLVGLSPRVWGNHIPPFRPPCPPRSIPTCVGKPWRHPSWYRPAAVYPHVCGETE